MGDWYVMHKFRVALAYQVHKSPTNQRENTHMKRTNPRGQNRGQQRDKRETSQLSPKGKKGRGDPIPDQQTPSKVKYNIQRAFMQI
jgi:hypothetical protein